MEPIEYKWKDRKRHLGLPLSFTRYRLSEDRLFYETGLLNLKCDEVLLYRVRDLQLSMSIIQRLFGVGTICVISSDQSAPHLDLKNIKKPREVKELIHQHVAATGSARGQEILDNFAAWLPKFKKVLPHDYDKMLRLIAQMEEKGEDSEQAQIEAFYAMKNASH